jgi:hypothetical protein
MLFKSQNTLFLLKILHGRSRALDASRTFHLLRFNSSGNTEANRETLTAAGHLERSRPEIQPTRPEYL